MDLRSSFRAPAAIVGTLVMGTLASTALSEPPARKVAGKLAVAMPADGDHRISAAGDSSAGGSADSLDRPVDEIRNFFGYPSRRKPAGTGKESGQPPEKPARKVEELAQEIRHMASVRNYGLRFLVALVPHPSQSSDDFDAYAMALRHGASASGWLLDRYWFPWQLAEFSSKSTQRQSTRGSPGVVLFQKEGVLLTVFLVGEHRLSGIPNWPFVDALRLISSLMPNEELQILGPFYSGTATSCSLALGEWCIRSELPRANAISFLSGSATNPDVAKHLMPLQSVCGSLKVTFQRTVVSDILLQQEGFKFFEKELGWHHEEIALLAESNSFYGQTLPQDESAQRAPTERAPTQRWRLILADPSALQNRRSAPRKAKKAENGDAAEVKSDGTGVAGDLFPVLDPITAPLTELELKSLLSTLTKERIRHLGLVFTDVRDRLLLAEKIKEYAPEISIFAFESSLLYVHPQVNPYMDGMLLVSSYPLTMVTQQLMGRSRDSVDTPRQFGSTAEQGVYNATVIALSEHVRTPPVVDYLTIPGTAYRAPGVWISAVGDGRIVPLAAIRPYEKSDLPQYFGSDQPESPPQGSALPPEFRRVIQRLGVPPGFRFCFWAVSLGLFFVCVSYAFGYLKPKDRRRGETWPPVFFRRLERSNAAISRQYHRWNLALVCTASVLWVAMATVYLVPFILRERFGLPLEITEYAHNKWLSLTEEFLLRLVAKLLPLFGLLLIVLLAYLGWLLAESAERRGRIFSAAVLGSTIAVSLLVSNRALSAFRPAELPGRVGQAVFTFLRASSGPGNLSPLLGMLLLAGGFGLLLVFHLERLRIRDGWACSMPTKEFGLSRDVPLRGLDRLQEDLDLRIRQALPRSLWFWIPLLAFLTPFLIAFFLDFEVPCDSFLWSKSFAFLFGFLLLPASLAAFSRFTSLWWGLRRIIGRQELSDLVPAFKSWAKELEWHPLKALVISDKHDYSKLVRSVERLHRLSIRPDLPETGAAEGQAAEVPRVSLMEQSAVAERALAEIFEANAARAVEPERAAQVLTLETLDAASQYARKMLDRLDAAGAASGDPELRKELTEFLALRATAYIRYLFAEIRNSLLAFTAEILFLLVALDWTSPQWPRYVYVVLWSVIGVAAIWTVAIFIKMDRNVILSQISNTTPGKINLIESGLLLCVVTLVLPSVVYLLLKQFPQIGMALLNWIYIHIVERINILDLLKL